MWNTQTVPVIVDGEFALLKLACNAVSQDVLDVLVFREGDVSTLIQDEPTAVAERACMAAQVIVLVVAHERVVRSVERMGGTKP